MHDMKKRCQDHINRYVLVTTRDNQQFDGIIEHVDDEKLYLAVVVNQMSMHGMPVQTGFGYGHDETKEDDQRIFGPGIGGVAPFYGGYPGYWYGGFPPYGYGGFAPYGYPYRGSPFTRLVLPLAALTALSALPYYY